MGIRNFQAMIHQAKHIARHQYHRSTSSSSSSSSSTAAKIPKGHLAVYVGESCNTQKNRFVVPISYLNHPLFQDLLRSSEEEYGFDHPMGGLTIPCSENAFVSVTSYLNGLHFHDN